MHAGVSHDAIREAVQLVRDAVPGYDWSCMPGRWLTYTLLLALPFPAKVVRPDAPQPVWFAGRRTPRCQCSTGPSILAVSPELR